MLLHSLEHRIFLVLEKRHSLSNRHSIWIFGTKKNVHMTSAGCWANPSQRTHDRSMMHVDRARSNRERLALRHPAPTYLLGRFEEAGTRREYFPGTIWYLFF